MAQLIELDAEARPRGGKGAARQARRDGKIPAVIYGDAKPAESINIDYQKLWKQVLKGKFTSTVFNVDIGGKKQLVIPRDLQVDPVKDTPLHVDFLRVGKDGIIRVGVAVKFVGETLSPGLKRGGILNIVRHDIEVLCPYDKIPDVFEVSLEGLDIGRSIHISAVPMPEGVRPAIKDRDFTIATIAGQRKDEEALAAADAAAAPGAAPAGVKGAAPAAGAKVAAPAAGGKAPAAGAKAPAAGAKAAPAAKPAAKK
jgi:large subunit ribosomal protein L25